MKEKTKLLITIYKKLIIDGENVLIKKIYPMDYFVLFGVFWNWD